MHQRRREREVVEGDQARGCELADAREVVQVAAGVVAARGARAVGGDRIAALGVGRLLEVEPPALVGVGDEGGAVAGQPGGCRAVEGVDAHRHAGEQVVHVPDPEEVPGLVIGRAL